mmetsp:Transcript_84312/g.126396  ORF Transcript_84312/g.126396 Transcript_84312/m.126396 type:complete len:85 (-) Transcript_84312:39-293(-)
MFPTLAPTSVKRNGYWDTSQVFRLKMVSRGRRNGTTKHIPITIWRSAPNGKPMGSAGCRRLLTCNRFPHSLEQQRPIPRNLFDT